MTKKQKDQIKYGLIGFLAAVVVGSYYALPNVRAWLGGGMPRAGVARR